MNDATATCDVDPIALRKARKRVYDRNRRFRALTPAQQRVRIARDVIEQLTDGTIRPRKGRYFVPTDSWAWETTGRETQVHAALEAQRSCQVCALGAAFVCAVRRANNLKMDAIPHIHYAGETTQTKMRSYLSGWFDPSQLGLIEAAFEGHRRFAGCHELATKAAQFGLTLWGPEGPSLDEAAARTVMIAIMRNIIDNRGEFVP